VNTVALGCEMGAEYCRVGAESVPTFKMEHGVKPKMVMNTRVLHRKLMWPERVNSLIRAVSQNLDHETRHQVKLYGTDACGSEPLTLGPRDARLGDRVLSYWSRVGRKLSPRSCRRL
jgi:hypothetical protein